MDQIKKSWLSTDFPNIFFEDNAVGKLKKEIFEAPIEEIEKILEEYGVPSPPELGKGGTYIQTTPRAKAIEKRKKNDIVLLPIGCTENHGDHANSGLDTFMVTQICEALRRYTAKQGREVNLAFTPINYGGHPYHHMGMPGTIIIPPEVVREMLIYTMLGLWNDGYRKIIMINNHGHLWTLVDAVQEFMKRFQLPAIVNVIDWHRAVREFFFPIDRDDSLTTNFIHADEAETAVAMLMYPDMIDMKYVQDSEGESLLPQGHFDLSVDPFRRPMGWSQGEGQTAMERFATPEGVVGKPSRATAEKAKRPVAAALKYLTLLINDILDTYPSGKLPDKVSLRDPEQLKPFLQEPFTPGWKSVYELPHMGPFHKG